MMIYTTLKRWVVVSLSMVLCLAYGTQSLSCVCVPSKPLSCSSEDGNVASASCEDNSGESQTSSESCGYSCSSGAGNSKSSQQDDYSKAPEDSQACANPCTCIPVVVETKREIPLLHKNLSDNYRDSHTSVLIAGVSSIAFLQNQYQITSEYSYSFPTLGRDMNATLCVWLY